MKQKFTYLIFLLATMLPSTGLFAQANGDYRSAGTGLWSALATWEVFNGATWGPVAHAPSSSDGEIRIKPGHTVTLDINRNVDQLVIEATGTLIAEDPSNPTPLTLGVVPSSPADIQVDGTLNLGGAITIDGVGATILATSGGVINWTDADLKTNLTVDPGATLNLSTNVNKGFESSNLMVQGIMNWATGATAGGLLLTNANVVINGTLNEQFQSSRSLFGLAGTNTFTNNGLLNKTTTFTVNINTVDFDNEGTIQGFGGVNPSGGAIANFGILQPGNLSGSQIGTLTIPGSLLDQCLLSSIIATPGFTAGTNYDQFIISNLGTYDLSNMVLNVSDIGSNPDPVGTSYTILTAPAGTTFTGSFSSVNVTPDLNPVPVISGNTISILKATPLPLTWGEFNALAVSGNSVLLNWSTLMEQNTSHFVVEYSVDGKKYNSIGQVAAAGNSNQTLKYSFTHASPSLTGANFYRLLQVDLDGKSTYSPVRVVRFNNGQVVKVLVYPNPVHDVLQMSVQDKDVIVHLYSADGKALRTWQLLPGTQQVNIHDLPAGNYQLMIYQKGQKLGSQQILKF